MQNSQGSQEWHEERSGKITASNFHKLAGNIGLTEIQAAEYKKLTEKIKLTDNQVNKLKELTDKKINPKIPDTFETYIFELIANEMGAMNDEIDAFALKYGKETEPIAREYFEKATGKEVELVGFETASFDNQIGYSGDGYIRNEDSGAEIKCPLNIENHVKYMTIKKASDLKDIEPKYYWQIMFSLYCSGLKSWYFISFHPKFEGANRMHIINIKPDCEVFKFIAERIELAKKLKEEIKNRIKL